MFRGLQRVTKVPLSLLTIVVESPLVYTRQGVPLAVNAVAQVKIHKLFCISPYFGKCRACVTPVSYFCRWLPPPPGGSFHSFHIREIE